MSFFLLALPVFLSLVSADAQTVKVAAAPNAIYIEKTAAAQNLNFDFVVENTAKENLLLTEVEVSVFDDAGKLVVRKFIDGNGVRPSIETVPQREFEPNKPQMIFNPFYTFAPDIELKKLAYKFKFETKDGKQEFVSEMAVSPVVYQLKTDLILPVGGRSIIYDGHDFYAHHRRFDYVFEPIRAYGFTSNFMRYSYDFVPVNDSGEMFKGEEENNASYFGFGANLYAAGAGKIAAMVDKEPDNRKFDESLLPTNQMTLFGNYIVIDHGNGEFSLYGHIKQSSAKVKVGDSVKQNQVIAQIGASGSSKFPHLHYELQSSADARAEGLPSYFRNFRLVRGAKTQMRKFGQIDSGDIVEK
ncbi:MAG: M23 family metallopeptidase [Acidobacteria bacterium]|nr:M23 family metallopeptidase [Acidobacteriota bacterium]